MKFLAFLVTIAFVHTAGADEPWMYPVDVQALVTPEMHNSHAVKIARVSRLDAIHSEVSTRIVDADVASFEDIAKWYSEKLGGTDLPSVLASYNERPNDSSEVQDSVLPGVIAPSLASLTYRFTPKQKQITILPADSDGHLVAVWLLQDERQTRIQVVRRYVHTIAQLTK